MTSPTLTAPSPESSAPLVQLEGVRQVFPQSERSELVVLDGVDFTLHPGEIVGLLGRSGSGKSTLLRIISGLLRPSAGTVRWRGEPVSGPCQGVAMVFQSFALFPWLTVLQNVELGLEAQGVAPAERRRRALAAIDLIGLDGFESAYPKELSGGMRQRVGLARALVVQPRLLLMDEAFSALDVLTAETLRTELLDGWIEGRLPISSILMVTHNIEEAVLLCDRILVLSSHPGRVTTEFPVTLAHPRNRLDPPFRALVDHLYGVMTQHLTPAAGARHAGEGFPGVGLRMALPRISTNRLAGLLEALAAAPFQGKADLPVLAASLHMTAGELLPAAETLQLLRLAVLADGDLHLTEAGQRFVELDVDARKRLFGQHLLAHVPLVARLCQVLAERADHRAPFTRFSQELEDSLSAQQAEDTLRAVISWGRYGELFGYDEHLRQFNLDNPT